MERRLLLFVWRNSRADQIKALVFTATLIVVTYLSLEVPKIIVNQALGGANEPVAYPKTILGVELDRIPFLILMCGVFIALIVISNALKYLQNVQIGLNSERLLRRLRYQLYAQTLRFRLRRFRSMKQGEIVQSIMGEVEPLGGFFGEVIATPVRETGMLIAYMTFIFVQDPVLGVAAIALYPLQAWLVPKLQAKVVRLNKARVANARRIADDVGDSVGGIEEIVVNDAARWRLAVISDRLYENYRIRAAIFERKYLIKGLNNFLIALTPFAFYLFGGIQVIRGQLDLGALVAVLAAYKDVAGPWKALLAYVQRWSDLNGRYTNAIDAFMGDEVFEEPRLFADGAAGGALAGPVELVSVRSAAGSGLIRGGSATIPEGAFAGVLGGAEGARETLLKMIAGLEEPEQGRVSIGGRSLAQAPMPLLGACVGYASAYPTLGPGPLRETLTLGLRRSPAPFDEADPKARERREEALRAGAIDADPGGDWIDYAAAGVEDPAALDARLVELMGAVGLSEELYHLGLEGRLDPTRDARLAEDVMVARASLREQGDVAGRKAADIADLVEFWRPDALNGNASLLENVLYAMPVERRAAVGDYALHAGVADVLKEIGAYDELIEIGWDIAEQIAELISAVGEDSELLDNFAAFPKKDVLACEEMSGARGEELTHDGRRRLLGFALAFTPTRDRLDVIDDARADRLLALRGKAREALAGREDFVGFDEERYSPALSISDNLLPGKRRFDRRRAWRRIDEFLDRAVDESGLRAPIARLGLDVPLVGVSLSLGARRRVTLARALAKRPRLLVVEALAQTAGEDCRGLRAEMRRQAPEATIVIATEPEAAGEFDVIVAIDEDGRIGEDRAAPEPEHEPVAERAS